MMHRERLIKATLCHPYSATPEAMVFIEDETHLAVIRPERRTERQGQSAPALHFPHMSLQKGMDSSQEITNISKRRHGINLAVSIQTERLGRIVPIEIRIAC